MNNLNIFNMKIELTAGQKAELELLHRACRNKGECDRIKAILLASEGWSTPMIAQALRLHETSVQRHISEYLNNGKLMPENGGSDSHLSKVQTAELTEYLANNLLPTTHAIIELVDEWWGVRYTVAGMTKWLHRNGFSYRKPAGIPHKFSPEAQQAFRETYENLKQEASDDEPVLFIDGVHPTQGTKLAYGWMPAGKKAHVVETTGSRTRLNIMGALNLNDIGSLNICRFFIAIRETYPITQKVHIILDGAGCGAGSGVAIVMNIELHYLPPYSPNLNPTERLW